MVMGMAWSAQDCVAIACGTACDSAACGRICDSSGAHGTIAVFTVIAGPALQPLHTLTTGGVVEDLSFSPDGTFVSFLDQGMKWCWPPLSHGVLLEPESEVVVLHVPSQQSRRFGSRKEAYRSDRYVTVAPTGASDSTKWPGRACLWWQGSSLMSYGPGGLSDIVPSSDGAIMMRDVGPLANFRMPCERLDLG